MYTVLKPFEAILPKDIHAITYPCEINGLGFVPYLNNESWETVQPSTEIVFTHNTFVGADFGFKIADGGIPLSSVSCDLVVSGHIHKQQILQDKHTKIVYPGTPYAWSANDVDQHKSLMVLDTETLEMYAVASPMSTWRKIQIDLPAQSILVPASIRANDHLLVKLVGLRADVKAFAASSAIYDLKQRYASVSLSTEFLDSAKTSNTASIKANTTSDALDQYLKSVYKGSASVEDVRKEILSVLEMT
jgi:DNA repair exonuclease SbcCD nuclease subunit